MCVAQDINKISVSTRRIYVDNETDVLIHFAIVLNVGHPNRFIDLRNLVNETFLAAVFSEFNLFEKMSNFKIFHPKRNIRKLTLILLPTSFAVFVY